MKMIVGAALIHDTPVVDVVASGTSADAQLPSIQAIRLKSEQDLWQDTPYLHVGADETC